MKWRDIPIVNSAAEIIEYPSNVLFFFVFVFIFVVGPALLAGLLWLVTCRC